MATSIFQDLENSNSTIAGAIVTSGNAPAMRVQGAGTPIDRVSFTKAISGGIDPLWGSVIATGTGMTVNQTGGNLVLTTGTTARAETIIRSLNSTNGDIRFRQKTILSQRIANQNFIAEMVDIIGDGLPYTITSATAISVTMPTGTFSSQNVGQSVTLCGFSGTGTFLSGRYVIASVSGDVVTFTVSGFAAGTGTLTACGLNFYRIMYDGTTATQAKYDTGRSGYGSGDTTVTINTSAGAGHIAIITGKDMVSTLSDSLTASATAVQLTPRGNRQENVPTDRSLYVQIRALNLATAPASNTTWTIGFASVAPLNALDVAIQDVRPMSLSTGMPVEVIRTVGVGTTAVTLASTTVTASTPAAGTMYSIVTAASTNAAFIKASAGTLFEMDISNPTASTVYVKIYNKTTAPTVGTDVPILSIPVAAGTHETYEFGAIGKRFLTGIAIAVTSAMVATDTTVATAGAQVSLTYI